MIRNADVSRRAHRGNKRRQMLDQCTFDKYSMFTPSTLVEKLHNLVLSQRVIEDYLLNCISLLTKPLAINGTWSP